MNLTNFRLTVGAQNRFRRRVSENPEAIFDALAELLFECLKRGNPDLTRETFEDDLDEDTLREAWALYQGKLEALGKALDPTAASLLKKQPGSETSTSQPSTSD